MDYISWGYVPRLNAVPVHFLEFLEPFIAIGDSHSACSALCEINPQIKTFGCKQLSGLNLLPRYQRPARMSPAFDGLYFLVDCKVMVIHPSLMLSLCIFWSS